MNLVELEPGFIADADTGEITDYELGGDPLYMAAQRFFDAKQQAKEWGARAGMWQAILLKGQDARKAIYGDVAISTQYQTYPSFDKDGWREFAANEELPAQAWKSLALAATGFDKALIEDEDLAEMVAGFVAHKEKAPFALATVVMKRAPKTKSVPAADFDSYEGESA